MIVAKFISYNPVLSLRYASLIAGQLGTSIKVQKAFKDAISGMELFDTWSNFAGDAANIVHVTELSNTVKAAFNSVGRLHGLKIISLGKYLPILATGTKVIAFSVSAYKLKTSYDKYKALPRRSRSQKDLVAKITNFALATLSLTSPMLTEWKTSLSAVKLLVGTIKALITPYPKKEKFDVDALVYSSLKNI